MWSVAGKLYYLVTGMLKIVLSQQVTCSEHAWRPCWTFTLLWVKQAVACRTCSSCRGKGRQRTGRCSRISAWRGELYRQSSDAKAQLFFRNTSSRLLWMNPTMRTCRSTGRTSFGTWALSPNSRWVDIAGSPFPRGVKLKSFLSSVGASSCVILSVPMLFSFAQYMHSMSAYICKWIVNM